MTSWFFLEKGGEVRAAVFETMPRIEKMWKVLNGRRYPKKKNNMRALA
jgi:hypothetical protein